MGSNGTGTVYRIEDAPIEAEVEVIEDLWWEPIVYVAANVVSWSCWKASDVLRRAGWRMERLGEKANDVGFWASDAAIRLSDRARGIDE